MDIVGWLLWLGAAVLNLTWSIVWFLLGGWVVTAAQILVVVTAVFAYKYGWRRAPVEVATRLSAFGRFVWAWVRRREIAPDADRPRTRRADVRIVRRSHPGDVNISTVLSLIALAAIGLVLLI
jgi:hypothetical protein